MYKVHYLYETINLVNGKKYLGKHTTKNIEDGYLGSGTLLKAAIKKYSANCFSKEIISFFDSKEAVDLAEKNLITDDIVNDPTYYNLIKGGTGGDARNFHRNSSPLLNAIKAAKTLRARPNTLANRNKKIAEKQKMFCDANIDIALVKCKKMNNLMRGATKENSLAIQKQIQNRKKNHAIKMAEKFAQFKNAYEISKDVRAISDSINISHSTGYRFAKAARESINFTVS